MAAMRLIQFALGLTLLLLVITVWLAWEGHQEARGMRQRLDMIERNQAAQAQAGAMSGSAYAGLRSMAPPPIGQAAAESPSPAAISPPPAPPASLGSVAGSSPAAAGAGLRLEPSTAASIQPPAAPPPLSALQQKVLAMPAIAKVKEFHKNEGFAIIDAGAAKQITAGMKFDLRRQHFLVGRITVSDSIEDAEAVADVDPQSIPEGLVPQPGDEVIQVLKP